MLLLDTHAFVWLVSDADRLSDRAKAAIRSNAGELYLAAISGLEIGLLVKRGRLELPIVPEAFIERGMNHHGITEVPMTWRIAHASSQLPDIHNDPFDRIIIATALNQGATILTMDRIIAQYEGAATLW
ncbi:MAG: type II toxin-antitoxin system VapC family toxin [Verrucomicrobia bacterium]|nr:type II toxin-antitoxin system VapC family toxin [Verrucomicrobiota bacterium]MDA1087412.1 type II toxin-antitoxin system VapC family toxin [Verrucomicrobiota bacterium]